MKRTMWLWALLVAAMGVLTLGATDGSYPLITFSWFVTAALLVVGRQPVFLALAAVQWGLSLASFAPGFQELLGPDPLVSLFEPSTLEIIVLIVVRVVFMASTWNQFLLYRLLYGTEAGYGLEEGKAEIPEIIPNRSNRLAWAARLIGFCALAASLIAIPLRTSAIARHLLSGTVAGSILAIGLGLGVSFSPTHKRRTALIGVALGIIAFFLAALILQII
jgi:hypothetical protein